MVNTFGAKNKGFDRKKATQLAQMIIEEKVAERDNETETFWRNINYGIEEKNQPRIGFDGYLYDVTYSKDGDNGGRVIVEVKMEGRDETVTFERFFAKL
jgi:hypothetical protein